LDLEKQILFRAFIFYGQLALLNCSKNVIKKMHALIVFEG